jgi:hypothetical protein
LDQVDGLIQEIAADARSADQLELEDEEAAATGRAQAHPRSDDLDDLELAEDLLD